MSYIEISYTGTIAAGEILTIDGVEKTVDLDDTNALKDYTGNDFPVVFPGTGNIGYEDSEVSRNLKISVIREEKHI